MQQNRRKTEFDPMEEDLYPSRVQSHPIVIPRKDPVVYSEWREGAPLTLEQTAFYRDNGFLTLDLELSEAERAALQNEMERLAVNTPGLDPETVITEPGSGEIRSIFRVDRASARFAKLLHDPRLVRVAQFLLNDDVYVHQSRLNYKPGFKGKEFYWHSDFETWHVEDGMPRMRALSMSIALTPNTEFNGPLMVIPGSHQSYICCVGETPDEHYKESLKKQDYGVPDRASLTEMVEAGGIVAPKGPIGSVTIFDCNVMHGSNGNITPWPRSNIFAVYNSVSNRVVAPFGGKPPRPDFLAVRGDIVPL